MPAKCITPQSVADESEAEIARLTAANKELADALRGLVDPNYTYLDGMLMGYQLDYRLIKTAREVLARHAK